MVSTFGSRQSVSKCLRPPFFGRPATRQRVFTRPPSTAATTRRPTNGPAAAPTTVARIASLRARSASSHTEYVSRSAALWSMSMSMPPLPSRSRAEVTEFASQTTRATKSRSAGVHRPVIPSWSSTGYTPVPCAPRFSRVTPARGRAVAYGVVTSTVRPPSVRNSVARSRSLRISMPRSAARTRTSAKASRRRVLSSDTS
jgi:hypothetical protein